MSKNTCYLWDNSDRGGLETCGISTRDVSVVNPFDKLDGEVLFSYSGVQFFKQIRSRLGEFLYARKICEGNLKIVYFEATKIKKASIIIRDETYDLIFCDHDISPDIKLVEVEQLHFGQNGMPFICSGPLLSWVAQDESGCMFIMYVCIGLRRLRPQGYKQIYEDMKLAIEKANKRITSN